MTVRRMLSQGFAVAASLALAAPPTVASPGRESPFACSPSALSPVERKQHFEDYGPSLRARLQGVRETSDGYEFTFQSDPATYRLLAAWMLQERRCCPFFDLALRLEREGGPLALRLTGREGVKAFIVSEFEPWFSRAAHRR